MLGFKALHTNRLSRGCSLAALILMVLLGLRNPAWAAEPLTLNLSDADINAVIATVSEMTGKNFIVDPRVKGKVSVVSSSPMDADEVYQVFLSILSVHGYAAVPGDNVIKIVPEVNAKQSEVRNATDRSPGRGDEYVTRVIVVENVEAARLVPILRPLLPQQGHLAAYQPSNVLIASATAATIERLVQIIRRVDLSSDSELEIIPLHHASAEEVVRVLTSLNKPAPGKGQPPVDEAVQMVADTRTNSILLSGERAARLRLRTIISHLDTPMEATGNTQVIYLKYANAKELVTVLNGVSSSITAAATKGKAPAVTKSNVNIQADESTNALVINAPPDILRNLKSVVNQLDVRRAQVMVEAIIAEVSLDKTREFGIQWVVEGSADDAPVGVINFGSLLAEPPYVDIGTGVSILAGKTSDTNSTRYGAFLKALKGDADTNILSTPTLVTMDNEEAEIVVGENVPFVTGSYSSTGGGSTPTNPFQTIQRQDIGLTLKVKPQVNEGSAIKLDITQEVSSVSSSSKGAADIITNKRSLKTTVIADDGQMIVLGGLIDDQIRENVQKVPLLGDIPILGWFFSHKRTEKIKRNLMVFIHPTILRDAATQMAVTNEKYNYIRARQMDIRERGVALMDDEESPLMPNWEEFSTLPPPYQGDEGIAMERQSSNDPRPPSDEVLNSDGIF